MTASKGLTSLARTPWLFGAWLAFAACSSPDPADQTPAGPAMGIVEVDPTRIPLGEGGSSAHAGSGSGGGSIITQPSGKTMLVGKPCETTTDCPTGQSCHMDQDYIAHLQCTVSCDSDAPCEAIEKGSFCIGANVCVHACSSDADCGPKTRCGTSGWCERTGPGSGVPYCGGLATPCSLLSDTSCASALGCRDDSQCGGVSESCYSQFSSFSCNSQDGCFWSSSSDDCSGSAHSCSSYSFDFGCQSQAGCYWTPRCSGTPEACEDTPVSLCAQQPGCTMLHD
jgi:hypothetical protein